MLRGRIVTDGKPVSANGGLAVTMRATYDTGAANWPTGVDFVNSNVSCLTKHSARVESRETVRSPQ